ncbi:MAG: carbon-nitrogen hydrolase family protein [Deltaproteobacteria bacterium]|nr:carbon-nitrogen hydrolase family protein [Deltaproteobacteria bacterium]
MNTHFTIRQAELSHIDSIIELHAKTFPDEEKWTYAQIKSQIETFPEGQICIFENDTLVAASSACITELDVLDEALNWEQLSSKGTIDQHDPSGDTLVGIEMIVDPEYTYLQLEQRIYDQRKKLAHDKNLWRIILCGRLDLDNLKECGSALRTYVDKVKTNETVDRILGLQLSNDFSVKKIAPNFFGEGIPAVYVEWVNLEYSASKKKKYSSIQNVRICAVQYRMRMVNNFSEFANQCEYFVDVASGYRSDFVLFPELLTLQLLSYLKVSPAGLAARELTKYSEQYIELFSDLALKHNINIVAGSHFTTEGDKLLNCSYLFHRNGEIDRQEKIHITPSERNWWGVQGGEQIKVFDTDCGPVAIQICYDIEFPEQTRIAVEKGARIIFVPFCTDERHGYLRVRYCAQARCIENQIYVAIAGTVGNLPQVENLDIQYAQAAILTPSDFAFARDGIAAESTPNIETVVIHDVDLSGLARNRKMGTTLNWKDRRLDLYSVVEKN